MTEQNSNESGGEPEKKDPPDTSWATTESVRKGDDSAETREQK